MNESWTIVFKSGPLMKLYGTQEMWFEISLHFESIAAGGFPAPWRPFNPENN